MGTSADNLQKRGRVPPNRARKTANTIRGNAAPVIKRAAGQALAGVKQGLDAITDKARQASDVSVNASDSIVAYAKKKPVKALAIAAASGALLHAALKVLTPSRD